MIDPGAGIAAIVTDRTVGPLLGAPLAERLRARGLRAPVLEVPPGEAAKTWPVWIEVLRFLEENGVDRRGAVIALGGGTIGDLAGFAAAVWLRGITYYQVPTTLLAMVDASVGGKTAIDTARTKNSVGAFWQPAAVIADLGHLATLPERDYLAAFAEIVKHGLIRDAELLEMIRAGVAPLRARSFAALEPIVARNVEVKAAVVVSDERESSGARAILNYGHTVAHGLEIASGYAPGFLHGHAVANGMRAAGWISARLGMCPPEAVAEQDRLLAAFDLPPPPPRVDPAAVVGAMSRDKKAVGAEVAWVLLRAVGRAEVGHRVPPEVATEAVQRLLEGRLEPGGL
jgi:3-dehydroquinate synthase